MISSTETIYNSTLALKLTSSSQLSNIEKLLDLVSNSISPEMIKKFEVWKNENLQNLTLNSDKYKSSQILTTLLFEFIYPAIVTEDHSDKKKKLWQVEKTTKEMISITHHLDEFTIESQKSQLKSILEKLEKFPISDSLSKLVKEWKITYENFFNLQSEEAKENISIGLYMLLYDVIYPAIANDQSIEEQQEIVIFDTNIRALLQSILTQEQDIDHFLKEVSEFDDEERFFSMKLLQIKLHFHKKMNEIFQMADCKNQDILQAFENFKQRLLETNQNRMLKMNKFHDDLDILTTKLDDLRKQLYIDATLLKETAKNMEVQHQAFIKIEQNFLNFLKKI